MPSQHAQPSGWDHVSAISLADFFGVVRRNLWLVVVAGLVTAAPIMYRVMRQPPVYNAEALVRLIDLRGQMTGGLPEQMMGRNADAILSQIEVLRGRYVIGRVVDQEGLRLQSATVAFPTGLLRDVHVADDATASELTLVFRADGVRVSSNGTAVSGPYGRPLSVEGVTFTVPQAPTEVESAELYVVPRETAIDLVLERLVAEPRDRTDAVAIRYAANDPWTAQRVTNTIVNVFQSVNAETAQEESRRQRIFLEERLAETDSLLREAEAVLTAFRTDRQFYSSEEMVTAQQQSLLDLDARRATLSAERQMYGDLLRRLEAGDQAGQSEALQTLVSSPGIASNPVVTALHAQLTAYKQERDALATGPQALTAENPRLITLNGLIRTAEQELASAIRSHVNAVDAQIAALADLRGQTAAQMSALPQVEIEDARLEQQAAAVRGVADQLRADLQRARMAEAVEVGQVQVVYEAPLPLEPESNGLIWKVTLGLMLGMLLGSGGALLRESMNTSIREPDELEKGLGLPGLAVVPHATHAGDERPAWLPRRSRSSGQDLAMLMGATAVGAEAYRMLRTNLLYSQSRDGLSTVLVTSAAPGEGKTTTAANLAIAFAQQGQRVLLIDCDLRRPRMHQVFNVDNTPGLNEVLTGKVSLRAAIQPTQVTNLSIVTAGSFADAPAELLSGERMRQLVGFASGAYDLVLLDTPPVLAAAESMALATLVDGVVLVVRAGQTDRQEARQAVRQLTDVGADLLGAVLNDPDSTAAQYGYRYRYYGGVAS